MFSSGMAWSNTGTRFQRDGIMKAHRDTVTRTIHRKKFRLWQRGIFRDSKRPMPFDPHNLENPPFVTI
jgi:hypothetical protein